MAKQELRLNYFNLYQKELTKLHQIGGTQILVGSRGIGKSHFLDVIREHALEEGWFIVEGSRRMVICKDQESFEKCTNTIALRFLKHLAKKVYIEKYKPSPPDEPVFLNDDYLNEELSEWSDDYDLRIPYEAVSRIIISLRLLERSSAFPGWWVRDRFFVKTINAFEEETINDIKEFFQL